MTPSRPTSLYRFYDADGELLYIGITDRGAGRWHEHSKVKPWWPQVATTTVEHYDDRASALEAEADAIKIEHPAHNVIHNTKRPDDPIEITLICSGCSKAIDAGQGYLKVIHDDAYAHRAAYDEWKAAEAAKPAWAPVELDALMQLPPEAQWRAWHSTCDPDPDADSYHIAASRISTWADVTEWTAHLMEKVWLDSTDWADILRHLAHNDGNGPLRQTEGTP